MSSLRLILALALLLAACADDPMAFRKSQMEDYESRFDSVTDSVAGIRRDCPRYLSVQSDLVAADRLGQEAAAKAYREAESATVLAYVNQRSSELLFKLAEKAVQNRCFSEADYLYDAMLRSSGDPVLRERARQRKGDVMILRDSPPPSR